MGMRKIRLWFKKKIYGYDIPDCKKAQPLRLLPEDRVLVLAPHADDETIGCGGFLLKYGAQCDVVLLTDGRYGDAEIPPAEMAEIRKKEFEEVMAHYAVRRTQMLNVEDGKLIDRFKDFNTLEFKEYDYVLMPHPMDFHKDHVAVSCLFKRACQNQPFHGHIIYYEIWNTLARPTHYIDISDVVEEKKRLINLYRSQVKNIDYASRILGLNHYRGLRHHVEYEEDFEIVRL
ncbi:MAG: PIG-L family deacetylase [Alphaproteobacteria bacterium]|nr:PIG-L family deacetylase [Alphaproteobacteria bacterium]MBO4644709.1 PIG-L family deacetylase [Alphaproteobacteria bacterium]